MVTFAIVEFTKDLTVEVVPSNWIVDNTCLWPPLRGLRFTAAAKKCETPTHLWKKYPIRVMGTYDTYECARGKLALSEETSALETDLEDDAPSRRRRKKSFPDYDDSEFLVDEPVSSMKHASQAVEKQTLHRMPIPPPALKGIFDTSFQGQRTSPRKAHTSSLSSLGVCYSPQTPTGSQTLACLSERSTPSNSVRSSSVIPSSGFGSSPSPPACLQQTSACLSDRSTPSKSVRRSSSVIPSSGFGNTPSPPARRPQTSTRLLERSTPSKAVRHGSVMSSSGPGGTPRTPTRRQQTSASVCLSSSTQAPTVVSSVSGQLKLILARLSVIDQCQRHQTEVSNQILHVLQHREEVEDLPDSIKEKIPMQSLDDVRYVEEQLEERKTFSKLTRHMGAIGGKDVAETTRNVMKNLMTNGLAARMNFVGRGGKTAIKNMKLLHVINGAVRRNKRLKNVTTAEVETVVKLWLRYARDRSGGRQARLEKQSNKQRTVFTSDDDLYD